MQAQGHSIDILRLRERKAGMEYMSSDEGGVIIDMKSGIDGDILMMLADDAVADATSGVGDRVTGGIYDQLFRNLDEKITRERQIQKALKRVLQSSPRELKPDTREKVCCRLCGAQLKGLAKHLHDVHGIDSEIYEAAFPGAPLKSAALEESLRAR